jgi:hypothetical protein
MVDLAAHVVTKHGRDRVLVAITHVQLRSPLLHAAGELPWRTLQYEEYLRTHNRTAKGLVDTPSSSAKSGSRRFLSSNVTRGAPARELIKPMLVPGRAEDCEDALDKGGTMGRSGARVSQHHTSDM